MMNARLSLQRLSMARFGLKGPGAADWLVARGVAVPTQHNTYQPFGTAGLIARLGYTEFYCDDVTTNHIDALQQGLGKGQRMAVGAAYPVLRQDALFLLQGDAVHELFAQTCSFHFAALDVSTHPVVMTSMIGVSVLVLPMVVNGKTQYRMACDPSFGSYLADTLHELIEDILKE